MMISKEEYLIGIYKIFGVALTAPFGKILLSTPDINFGSISMNNKLLVYAFILLILFLIGIVLLLTGYDIVYLKERK